MSGMKIGDNYIIETLDQLNLIVKNKVTPKPKKDGSQSEPTWKNIGYFPNLEMAFAAIVNKEINLAVDGGITKVIETIKDLKKFKKTLTNRK
ncbi:hypothetical protein EXM65_15495 [Clostridium botulinum]|uniref:Uncharacterized protein n=1 Tax=Clostridium botulinum TaxID=1491 RepID=A0A6M0SRL0_CLOBO|nr:hypothetical protein [Clostridium botulinum]NFQ39412.1 hypothetical protein [Clostridium botulinum]